MDYNQEGRGNISNEVDYHEMALEIHRRSFLMKHVWVVASITIAYIAFVKVIGPRYMENRRPFNVKYIMFVYNLFQVFANLYILREFFANNGFHFIKIMSLYGIKREENAYLPQLVSIVNLIVALKIVDLLDTVFMVLRKRFSQITFLHVYHHVVVVVTIYFFAKVEIGENLVLPAIINLTVHSIMYSYYCLSLSKRLSQNYLYKYKAYITRMQMIQFLIITIHMGYFVMSDIEQPPLLTWFMLTQATFFLALFGNFYIKTYLKKGDKQS